MISRPLIIIISEKDILPVASGYIGWLDARKSIDADRESSPMTHARSSDDGTKERRKLHERASDKRRGSGADRVKSRPDAVIRI